VGNEDVAPDRPSAGETEVKVEFAESVGDVQRHLRSRFRIAQIDYETKTRVMETATSAHPLTIRLSHLQTLDLDTELATAIGEILLARYGQGSS
jgi:hypothetical protein